MKLKTKNKIKLDKIEKYPYAPFSIYGDLAWNKTGSWRYVRPIYVESVPPCQAGCPTGENVEGWIKLLARKKYIEAVDLIRLENPFPSITGRVCFHPCENRCNRSHMGGAVSINMLEQFVADQGMDIPPAAPFGVEGGLHVAVVGSGPAGLAAAYHLTRLGHRVEIFEKAEKTGGMLRYGIPSYRLPRAVLDREIERLTAMGITIHTNETRDIDTLAVDFDRVVLAVGAQASRSLGIVGEDLDGVMHGLDFLRRANTGKLTEVPKKVAVIGGGNTAMDCARVALRLGAEDVTVYYRRTRAQMPAFNEEIEAAAQEGVKFIFLRSPHEFIKQDDALQVKFQVMQLGVPGEDGRRKPVPVDGQFESFGAELVLLATGEVVDATGGLEKLVDHGVIPVDEGMRTSNPKIFAVGDVTPGNRTVTDALGMGKTAAIVMDADFRGLDTAEVIARTRVPGNRSLTMAYYIELLKNQEVTDRKLDVVEFERMNPYHFDIQPRPTRPQADLSERMERPGNEVFAEINRTIPEEIALRESDRCMHCGRCIDCDNCYIYCPDGAITPKEGGGYTINMDYCKGCGVCVHECPRAAMAMIEEPVEF